MSSNLTEGTNFSARQRPAARRAKPPNLGFNESMEPMVVVSCLECWQQISVVAQTGRTQIDELLVDYGWQPVRRDGDFPQAFCPQHRRH